MPLFRYKAVDARGKTHAGQMEAGNAVDLGLRLDRMDLDLIRSREINPRKTGPGMRRPEIRGIGKIGRRELMAFCFHLEQMVSAGVPLTEALTDLRDSVEDPALRQVTALLTESIEGGKTLSGAMEAFPRAFDKTFIASIRAGESSGELGQVLSNLVENLKWMDETSAHVKKLFLYPAIVGGAVMGIVFFLMTYLVPKLVSFFTLMGEALPVHTRVLIAVSDFFVAWWTLILAAPIIGLMAGKLLIAFSPGARLFLDALLLKVWLVGPIRKKIILSRFARYFALLYTAGISVLECIRISQSLVGNKAIEMATQRAARHIADGSGISAGFESAGLFPPLVIRMLRVGENTGDLAVALQNVSYFYDRDVRESIARLQTLMEPAMTLILGIVLGWVMISVLGPMYELIAGFGY